MSYFLYFFFFQAEDGIRDLTVTGVQTCALPIWLHQARDGEPLAFPRLVRVVLQNSHGLWPDGHLEDLASPVSEVDEDVGLVGPPGLGEIDLDDFADDFDLVADMPQAQGEIGSRSEERRVGKE